MILPLLLLLLQVVAPARPTFPVQLGVSVTSDTVTVGQRFIAVIRVRAPQGATIEFPAASDSTSASSLTATQLIGKPVIDSVADSTGARSAAYRLAAWDTGLQSFGLPDVRISYNGEVGYISLADRGVFVRSVLPEDSTLRIPKPARPAIEISPFNWVPWLIALAVIAAGLIGWRLWVWYRRRKSAPVDPYTAAEREFARIEGLGLIESGEAARYAAAMSDVMRDYLAARVPEIERSHTSAELLAASHRVHGVAAGLGDLLWRADLIKFAGSSVAADEAREMGARARKVVVSVEDFLVSEEEKTTEQRSAA